MIAEIAGTVGFVAWLGTLWFAVGVIDRSDHARSCADRLRDVLVLLVGESFVLGVLGALYAWTLIALPLLVGGIAFGMRQDRSACFRKLFATPPIALWLLPLVTTTILAWPGFVRPILDGDSMSYHLPNAAAWATAHSVWTATTRYWWYPPASEMAASAVLLIGGPRCLGVVGFAVLLLLALRLTETFREFDCPVWPASLVSVAITTVPIIAQQTGSLQNDVWLAAWLLEGVVAARRIDQTSPAVWAVSLISKPVGWVFAFLGQEVTRTSIVKVALSAIPLSIWFVRDVILYKTVPSLGVSESARELWQSTILAQGGTGLVVLYEAVIHEGPGFLILLALVLVSPFAAPSAPLRMLPLVFALLFLLEPFGYATDVPQLATGASLRFALPALVLASLSLTVPLKRFSAAIAVGAAALTVADVRAYLSIFWNDANVHGAFISGLIVVLIALIPRGFRPAYCAAALTGLLCFAVRTDRSPQRYDDATIARFGLSSHVFEWFVTSRPARIVVWETDGGLVSTVSPATVVIDADALDPCTQARGEHALLLLTVEHETTLARRKERLAEAKQCGPVLFEDDGALVLDPARPVGAKSSSPLQR